MAEINAKKDIDAGRDVVAGDVNNAITDSVINQQISNVKNFLDSPSFNIYVGLTEEQVKLLIAQSLEEIKDKMQGITPENIVSPDRDIFVPVMQSLTVKFEKEDIRKIFINLVSNSMNKTKKNQIHPSYIEIVNQLSSSDAILFNEICVRRINPILSLGIKENLTGHGATNIRKYFYKDELIEEKLYEIEKSLVNLSRLGLIEISLENYYTTDGYYDKLTNSLYVEKLKNQHGNLLEIDKGVINITNFGNDFANVCLK